MRWLLAIGKSDLNERTGVAGGIRLTMCSILCGDYAIKRIDKPFVSATDDLNEWAL